MNYLAIAARAWSVVCCRCPSQRSGLLIHDLDLFVDHSAGKSINCHVHPVMLLPFYDEVILKAASIPIQMTSPHQQTELAELISAGVNTSQITIDFGPVLNSVDSNNFLRRIYPIKDAPITYS